MSTIRIYVTVFTILVSAILSEGHKPSNDWQYLVFAQQWPTTICLSQKRHKCKIPSYVSSWAVHGIWPSSKHGFPSFCNRSLAFNISAIKPIENELLTVWPNLFTDETIYSFWKHEWLKHGTCAISLPSLNTELKYFNAAIRAHNLYNILNFLEEDDITPDKHKIYSMENFRTAIENKTGKKAVFQCKSVKDYDSPLISTISICMDRNLTIMDCPTDSSCKSSIMYLPLTSLPKSKYVYIFHLWRYFSFLPTTYIVAGIVVLFIVVIIMWLFSSLKRNSEDKMYTVFTEEKCS